VEYLESKTVTVCASRSVAGRRLVETENHSAFATVDCNWCKREIVLYCQCLSVIYK
jgi:ribosomal protein S27E